MIQFPGVLTKVVGAILSLGGGGIALLVQFAAQPGAVVEQSLLNSTKSDPPDEVIEPGEFVPV